ncbi:MAG: hypothetical protein ACYDDC_07460, partial [Thermoplasmataceae archaeon]
MTATEIILSVLISSVISIIIVHELFNYEFNKRWHKLINNLNVEPRDLISKKSIYRFNEDSNTINILPKIEPEINLEMEKKIKIHLGILKKVAEDIDKSIVDPWPIRSLNLEIPAIPKRNERPLWDDLVLNHLAYIDRNFPDYFDKYQEIVMEYSRFLLESLKSLEQYLHLQPSSLINHEIGEAVKEAPMNTIFKRELLFNLINYSLSFRNEPEIKIEKRIKKMVKGKSASVLYIDGNIEAIIPENEIDFIMNAIQSVISGNDDVSKFYSS